MKKILFSLIILMFSLALNAQEPEKKKDTKSAPSSGTQERAINETGVSVKTKSQTKSSPKETSAPAPNNKKNEEGAKKEAKKPE